MQDIKYYSDLLKQGKLVAIPTETVYGLGADATNHQAVEKIFELKKRPADNPLIIHLADKSQIVQYADIANDIEQTIIDKLMPGPISILLKKKNAIPDIVTAGSERVAIRIPDHDICKELLIEFDGPIAAPSANISGAPSPTSPEMVRHNFGDSIPILDGGDCHVGIESTVVQVSNNRVLIHRPGFISQEDIQSLFSNIEVVYSNTKENISPGVKYKHYSPKAKIQLLDIDELATQTLDTQEFDIQKLNKKINHRKIGILATQEFDTQKLVAELGKEFPESTVITYPRGSQKDLIQCSQNLYKYYHQADKDGLDMLFVQALEEVGLGYAIMNRVRKSLEK